MVIVEGHLLCYYRGRVLHITLGQCGLYSSTLGITELSKGEKGQLPWSWPPGASRDGELPPCLWLPRYQHIKWPQDKLGLLPAKQRKNLLEIPNILSFLMSRTAVLLAPEADLEGLEPGSNDATETNCLQLFVNASKCLFLRIP